MSSEVQVRSGNELERIGVFGGTFDPVHNVHLDIARAARSYVLLDRVIFVISARPPHKTEGPSATPAQRLAMVEAAIAAEPAMTSSRIEIDRPGPSYTVDTLKQLREQFAGASMYLIIGFDSLLDFPDWKAPDEILRIARLLVVPRPCPESRVPSRLSGHYDILPFKENAVSSTEVRRRIVAGRRFSHLVPHAVERLILEEGIYRGGSSHGAR